MGLLEDNYIFSPYCEFPSNPVPLISYARIVFYGREAYYNSKCSIG